MAPDFTVEDLSGHPVRLRDFRGKNVFVHFWATWCPPCLVELPALARFEKRLDRERFVLLAVCVDRSGPDSIRAFMEAGGYGLEAYLDPGGRVAGSFGTVRFPETYLIDGEGVVRYKVLGSGSWGDPAWERLLHYSLQRP
ncbi:MAG: TlpA disulfide reductase family protein [bacterium]